MSFTIIREDITRIKTDAIVNSANPKATYGNGTDQAIYKAAGEKELLEARKKIGNIVRGEVAVTPAYNLKAKYIIHTVGPWWEDGNQGEYEILHSCYRKSLIKAKELGCKSIAFPLLATGTYGFPKDEALRIALDEINAFILKEEMDITLVVFDESAFEISKRLKSEVQSYVDNHYIIEKANEEYKTNEKDSCKETIEPSLEQAYQRRYVHDTGELPSYIENSNYSKEALRKGKIDNIIYSNNKNFKEKLNDILIEKNIVKNSDVYRPVELDRKVFSNIFSKKNYRPSKSTIILIALSLELSYEQTTDLLETCGYALSTTNKSEQVIAACIKLGCSHAETVAMLYDYDLPAIETIK